MNLSGNILDYFIVFWGGVLVSFSPCIFPVLPVTVSVISSMNTKGTKLQGFLISLIYVLGLAIVYSVLGVIAALTGQFFGQLQNNSVVLFIAGSVFIFFALAMFDVIPMFSFGGNLKGKIKLNNRWSILFLGMNSGLMVSPCATPILGSILLFVASKQNPLYAFSLLFVFSCGVGMSLVIAGTFSGFLSSLPKSGKWLLRIRQVCGGILFIIGIYILIKAWRILL